MEHAADATRYEMGPNAGPAAAATKEPVPEAATSAPEPQHGVGKMFAMELRMESLTHGKPEKSIETDLTDYLGFLGRKYGVSLRNVSYTRKGREETIVVRAVVERMPERGTQRTWTHSGGAAVSEWREER